MNDSDFVLSDLSPTQMRNLKVKLTATNPKLPTYIMENLTFFLPPPSSSSSTTTTTTTTSGAAAAVAAANDTTTATGVLSHLRRFYPNLRITHLVTISRLHLCHDFAAYLRYVMWQLATDSNDV